MWKIIIQLVYKEVLLSSINVSIFLPVIKFHYYKCKYCLFVLFSSVRFVSSISIVINVIIVSSIVYYVGVTIKKI